LAITEQQLVQACIKGNRKAQRQLYESYKRIMFGICLRYAHNRAEAEDMLQDGFVRIFRDLYQYKPIGPFGGWMRRVMVNSCLQHIRRRKKLFPIVDLQQIANSYQADDAIFSQFRQKALVNMIQQLPVGYRVVFNMYVIEGYSHKEIAEKLSISINTSKSQLSRAKAVLRKLLEKTIVA